MEEQKSELIELAALWRGTSKNGEEYWSGTLGKGQLMVFANKYKQKDNQPDLRIFIKYKKFEKKEGEQAYTPTPKLGPSTNMGQTMNQTMSQAQQTFGDELPF